MPSEKYTALPGGISVPQLPRNPSASRFRSAARLRTNGTVAAEHRRRGEFDQVFDTVVVASKPITAAVAPFETAPDEDFEDDMQTQRMDTDDMSPA